MNYIDFNEQIALSLLQSNAQFPIDFDDAWQWLNFSRKDSAKRHFMTCGFIENTDFSSFHRTVEREVGATVKEVLLLTIDCFKSWAMMVNTEKGKQVRLYFLECERKLKEVKQVPPQEFNLPKNYLEALKCLVVAEEEKLALQATIKTADEALTGYRNVFSGESTLSMKQASDALAIKSLGRNNLINYLRKKGMITKNGSSPTKTALDRGYLVAETNEWNSGGTTYNSQTGHLTWKGFCWLVQQLKADKYPIRQTSQAIWDNYVPINAATPTNTPSNVVYLPTAQ